MVSPGAGAGLTPPHHSPTGAGIRRWPSPSWPGRSECYRAASPWHTNVGVGPVGLTKGRPVRRPATGLATPEDYAAGNWWCQHHPLETRNLTGLHSARSSASPVTVGARWRAALGGTSRKAAPNL